MNNVILKDLAVFAQSFESYFLTTRDVSTSKQMDGKGLELAQNLFWVKFPFEVRNSSSLKVRYQLQRDFEASLSDIESEYLKSISNLLKIPVYFLFKF